MSKYRSVLYLEDSINALMDSRVNNDDDDDAGINKTVKPTAQMKLYKDGLDVSGSSVKLTDLVTLTIQVDDEFIADFDIKAKSCTANYIDIITDDCAADVELFPDFTHVTRGVITATFGAFRTTDLGSGLVEMTFTCTLQVCQDSCTPTTCSTGSSGWGRRKRAVEDSPFDDLNVGTSISVGTKVELEPTGKTTSEELCINTVAFAVVLLLTASVLITSMGLTSYVTTRLMRKSEQLRKLTEDTENMRKSPLPQSVRRTSVSVINSNSSPIPITTKTDCKTVLASEGSLPVNRNALNKQASVSVLYNPHALNQSDSQAGSTPQNQTDNASNKMATASQSNCVQGQHVLTSSPMNRSSNEATPGANIYALIAKKDKLIQYQNMLEQLGKINTLNNHL